MSAASPAANSNSAGLGSTWFKIWEWAPTYSASTNQLTFPPSTITTFNFTIPKSTPNGYVHFSKAQKQSLTSALVNIC